MGAWHQTDNICASSKRQMVRNQAGGEDPTERRLYIQHNDQFLYTIESRTPATSAKMILSTYQKEGELQ